MRAFQTFVLGVALDTAWIGAFLTFLGVLVEGEAQGTCRTFTISFATCAAFWTFYTFSFVQGPTIEAFTACIGITAGFAQCWT